MAQSNENKQNDLNMFKEETDSKNIEKKTLNSRENDISDDIDTSSIAHDIETSFAHEIEEEIADIQAVAIMAAAKSIGSAANNTEEMKPSNLDVEAALNSTFLTDIEENSLSTDRTSLNECKIAASLAKRTSENAEKVYAMGQDLMETIVSTIDVLKSHIHALSEKAVEAGELRTERGYRMADFYHTMASKYEASVSSLMKRGGKVEVALNRCNEAATECLKYSAFADEITDETSDDCRRAKFSACWWTNKGRAIIIVTLKKERAALLMMKRIWITMRENIEYEERNKIAEESSDEETQQCENRNRKTVIGHVLATLLGVSLLSITSLFKVGSESFNAILALGLLTLGWCAVYWSHKLYKCLKEHDNEQETVVESSPSSSDRKDGFLENCERRLKIVKALLLQYNVVMDSDTESDTGSSETVRVGDVSL